MARGGLVRHRAPGQSRAVRIFNGTLTGIGELLITAGLVVALFLVWQLWWTGIDANASAQAVATQFHDKQVESPKTEGTKHYDDPPVMEKVGYGETIGMLVVPKWYGVTNNNMPIMEGTGSDVLDQAAAGATTPTPSSSGSWATSPSPGTAAPTATPSAASTFSRRAMRSSSPPPTPGTCSR